MNGTVNDTSPTVDGDRDHMNKSNLFCPQTVAAAQCLRLCADEIERLRAIRAAMPSELAAVVERLRAKARYAELSNNSAMGHVVFKIEEYQSWKDADTIEAAVANRAVTTPVLPAPLCPPQEPVRRGIDRLTFALEKIALLDECDGHELKVKHAFEAVAIATNALGKHPSQIDEQPHLKPAPKSGQRAEH